MSYTVLIKDNIEQAIVHVRQRHPALETPLTEMIFGKILEQQEQAGILLSLSVIFTVVVFGFIGTTVYLRKKAVLKRE